MDDPSSSNSSSIFPLESAREADGEPNSIGGGRGFGCENLFPLWLMARDARIEGEGELNEDVSKSDSPDSDAERTFGSLSTGVEEGEGGYLKVRVAARGVMGGCI